MRYIMIALMLFTGGYASAHEWLPTYPTLKQSFVPGVHVTTMQLFNKREDAEWYEISVYDAEMNPVKFATSNRIINVKYAKKEQVDIYIREQDIDKAVYICSKSKLIAEENTATVVSSRICSKIK